MPNPVAVAAKTGLGTSPPSSTLGQGSTDTYGQILFGSGATPASGAILDLTVGVGWSGGAVTPAGGTGLALLPMNAATAALGPFYASWNSPGRILTISCSVAPTASQAGTTYVLSYTITG